MALAVTACQTPAEFAPTLIGRASMIRADGAPAGNAMIYSDAQEATISVALTHLAPGIDSVWLEQGSKCPVPAPSGSDRASASSSAHHRRSGLPGKRTLKLHDATIGQKHWGTVSGLLPGKPESAIRWLFANGGTVVKVAKPFNGDSEGKTGKPIACGVLHRVKIAG